MSSTRPTKLLNAIVAAMLLVPLFPAAGLAFAAPTPGPLAGAIAPADVPSAALPNAPLTAEEVLSNPTASQVYDEQDALPGPVATPAAAPGSAQEQEMLRQQANEYLRSVVDDESDLGLGIIDFLEKYSSFKQQVVDKTGVRALLNANYDFTDLERTLIEYRVLAMSQVGRTDAPPIIRHAELMATDASVIPLATAPTLVIDDDGSENNNGPGLSAEAAVGWPFTNQTEMVTASLAANAISFDLFVRPYAGNIPDFGTISSYDQIIYVTGQNFAGAGGAQLERRFTGFAEAEGDIWLIGQFLPFIFDGGLETTNTTLPPTDEFLLNIMGIKSYASFGTANPMVGTSSGFLSGQSYDMTRWLYDNISVAPLEYGFHLNYSSASSQGLTTGGSLGWNNDSHTGVMNNLRNHAPSTGVVLTSAFELSFMQNDSQRDDFVARMFANLSANSGLVWDTNTDVSPVDLDISPTIEAWAGGSYLNLQTGAAAFVIFNWFLPRWQPATVNVTIDNYRNSPFVADPRIILEENPTVTPTARAENSTLMTSVTIPARSSFNISFTFTPHRMWVQVLHVSSTTASNSDTVTSNNQLFGSSVGVAANYDGAETANPNVVANGFTRVNNPARANTGSWYWDTGTGANLNNSLTYPWLDVRCLNSTASGADTSPCAQRHANLIFDLLFLVFFINGSVVSPDALHIEYRNNTNMVWTTIFSISDDTTNATGAYQYTYYISNLNGVIASFGVRVPTFAADQFVQVRFRYQTGNTASSTGYKLDDVGVYTLTEVNNRPDFAPLVTNAIAAPSPTYTVYQGSTAIRSGFATGIIDINETEHVTFHAGIEDTHHDGFNYGWGQDVAGFATLPANSSSLVPSANLSWDFTTDLNSFENLCTARGQAVDTCLVAGGNTIQFSLTATDELNIANATSWTVRIRDAVPTWNDPTITWELPEDGVVWLPATGAFALFMDPENDLYTLGGVSALVGGQPTVIFGDNRSDNGTIMLRAGVPDWFGTTTLNITATDNKGAATTVQVNVTILPVNDAPRFDQAQISSLQLTTVGTQGQPLAFQFAFWDVDDPVTALSIGIAGNHASVWDNATFPTGDPNRGILNMSIGQFAADNSVVGRNYFNFTFCDASAACTVVPMYVTILNINDPPRIDPLPPVQYATQGVRFQLHITATDPDDAIPGQLPTTFYWWDDTTFFDVIAGDIDFVPTNAQVGIWQIVVRVNDSELTASYSFQLVINNTNDAPVLPATWADIIVSQDQFYSGTDIVATDLDLALWEQNVAESLVYSDNTPLFNVETVASPKPTGEPQYLARISFKPTNEQVGTWEVDITVTDAAGESSTMHLRVIVNNANDSPSGVRVNITSQLKGDTTSITVPNSKVSFDQDDVLDIVVTADDPDMHFRVNEPTVRVDPAEKMQCSATSQFVGSLGIPQPDYVKPTIDATCVGMFEPGNEEVGTFTVIVTVRDNSDASTSFRFQLEIRNINDPPERVVVGSPAEGFRLPSSGSVQLQGTASDPDSPDSALTYSWTVEIIGGQRYTANGKNAQVNIENPDEADHPVKVTLRVTDNLDITNPIVVEMTANGTIQGKPTTPGFDALGTIAALTAAVGIAGMAAWQRRRRGSE